MEPRRASVCRWSALALVLVLAFWRHSTLPAPACLTIVDGKGATHQWTEAELATTSEIGPVPGIAHLSGTRKYVVAVWLPSQNVGAAFGGVTSTGDKPKAILKRGWTGRLDGGGVYLVKIWDRASYKGLDSLARFVVNIQVLPAKTPDPGVHLSARGSPPRGLVGATQ